LSEIETLPAADELRQVALVSRPELGAIAARLRAEQSALALANKDYLPDFEVMGRYDAFWQEPQLRAMVGVNANVPIYHQRLNAAVREASFRISQKRAEYRQLVDDVQREVQTAYEQVTAAADLVELYRARIVPAARQNVEAARAGYVAGRVDFLRLIEAERQLINLLVEEQDLIAGYHALRAELERAIGGPLPAAGPADSTVRPPHAG
jgi:outer membrane protein TolC